MIQEKIQNNMIAYLSSEGLVEFNTTSKTQRIKEDLKLEVVERKTPTKETWWEIPKP